MKISWCFYQDLIEDINMDDAHQFRLFLNLYLHIVSSVTGHLFMCLQLAPSTRYELKHQLLLLLTTEGII